MAKRTSTQAGNTANSPFAFGSAVNAGDTLVCAHAVVFDGNQTIGESPPSTPIVAATYSSSAGASPTSLPTGTYRLIYTNVGDNGKETHWSPEISLGTITNGVTQPRVTLPALPSDVTSRNIYLSPTNGATLTEQLYATGITGTTHDLISATYADTGVTVTNSPGAVVYVATGGSLTIGTGITLTARGDIQLANAVFDVGLGSLVIDTASANEPANTAYRFWLGTASNQSTLRFRSGVSGSNPSNRASVSKNGSGTARICSSLVSGGSQFGDASWYDCHYTTFTGLGTSTLPAIEMVPSGSLTVHSVFDNNIFDACGRVTTDVFGGLAADKSFTYTNNTHKNSIDAGYSLRLRTALQVTGTPTRVVSGNVFDKPVAYQCSGFTLGPNNYYGQTWEDLANPTSTHTGELCRLAGTHYDTTQTGPLVGVYYIADPWDGATLLDSGTATGTQTSTTLQDTTKSWSVNAWQTAGGSDAFQVQTTGGTGGGQVRRILSNTTNTLTVAPPWDTTPDATTTYEVYETVGNPHWVNPSATFKQDTGTATSGTSTTLTDSAPSPAWSANEWLGGRIAITAGTGAGQTKNVLSNTTTVVTISGTFSPAPDNTSVYRLWHTAVVTNCMYEELGSDGSGDFYLHLESTGDFEVTGLVGLPSLSRDSSGVGFTLFGTSAGVMATSFKFNHNTIYAGVQGNSINEGQGAGASEKINEFYSNIVWNDPEKASYFRTNGLAMKIYDTTNSGNPAAGPVDLMVAGDFNAGWGLDTGFEGKGYHLNLSYTPGVNDIDWTEADTTGPGFVDRFRGLLTWAAQFDPAGMAGLVSIKSKVEYILGEFKKRNDASGFNPVYVISGTPNALYDWVRAGYAPTNIAIRDEGHDAVTIGAVEGVWPSATGARHGAIRIGQPISIRGS